MSVAADTRTEAVMQLFDILDGAKYLQQLGAKAATGNFVRNLINTGQVAHVRIGKKFYVARESFDQWIVKHQRRAQ